MLKMALIVLLFVSSPAFAAGEIVPTADAGSDCVAAVIYADRTEKNRKYDALYCSANRERSAYERCLANSSGESERKIPFFTDRCNEPDAGAYISFNGQTHQVWRDSTEIDPRIRYAGTYKGDGVVVRIVPGQCEAGGEQDAAPSGHECAVDVFIEHAGEKANFSAVYDDPI